MGIGPVEYLIIGFPGSKFTGEIVPELARLVDTDVIRIVDLVFISKDENGAVLVLEVDEDENLAVFCELDGDIGGIIGDEDVQHAAAGIPAGSSAALLLWEDRWAAPLVEAIRNAGGILVEGSRIPAELIGQAEALIDSAV